MKNTYTYRWNADGYRINDDVPTGTEECNREGDENQDHQPNDSPQRIHAENVKLFKYGINNNKCNRFLNLMYN